MQLSEHLELIKTGDEHYFSHALHYLLPALQNSSSSDERILSVYCLVGLYVPHHITINPFNAPIQQVLEKEISSDGDGDVLLVWFIISVTTHPSAFGHFSNMSLEQVRSEFNKSDKQTMEQYAQLKQKTSGTSGWADEQTAYLLYKASTNTLNMSEQRLLKNNADTINIKDIPSHHIPGLINFNPQIADVVLFPVLSQSPVHLHQLATLPPHKSVLHVVANLCKRGQWINTAEELRESGVKYLCMFLATLLDQDILEKDDAVMVEISHFCIDYSRFSDAIQFHIHLLTCAYAQQGDGEGNEGGGDSGGESSSDIDSGSSTDTLSSTTLIDKPSTTYTATATSIAVTSASSSIPTQTYVPLPQPNKNIDENPDESPEELPEMPLTIKITPAFGVLGAILIISAIPLAVLGSTSRWTGVCIPVSYGSMIALMCILLSTVVMPKLHSNNPERATEALEGEILVGCAILGIITAVASWWFQRYVAYAVCGFGGIALAWWIQCMRDGGTIHSMAGKWIFYIGLGTVAVVASFHPRIMKHLLRFSTSLIGSSAFILGIDCFVKSGLKEFYVYNLGYNTLYPPIKKGENFPLTQTEIILLAVAAAITLLTLALQYRLAILAGRKAKMGRDEEAAREMGLDPHDADVDSLEMKRNRRREDALDAWESQNGSGDGARRGAIAAAKQAVSGVFNKASTPVNLTLNASNDQDWNEKGAPGANGYRYSSSMEKGSYAGSNSVSPQPNGERERGEREREHEHDERLSPPPPAVPPAPTSPPPLLPPLSAFGESAGKPTEGDREEEDKTEKSTPPPDLPPPLEQSGPLPSLDVGFGSEMRTELGLPEPDPAEVKAEAKAAAEPVLPPRPSNNISNSNNHSTKRPRAPSAPALKTFQSMDKTEADLKDKEALLSDIANIRRSIDQLRSRSIDELREGDRAGDAGDAGKRSLSELPMRRNSKRAKSQSTQSFVKRPPADEDDKRDERNEGIVKQTEWEQYVRSRQVFAPPAGVSRPINQEAKDVGVEVSPAVAAAVEKRKHSRDFNGGDRYNYNQNHRYSPVASYSPEEWENVSPKQVFDDDLQTPARSWTHSQTPEMSHSRSHSHSNPNSAPGSRKNSIPFSYEIGRATPTMAARRPSASPSASQAYPNENVLGNMSHTRTSPFNGLSKFDSSDYGGYNNRNRSRSMTVEELQARHRAHLSRLQSPINEKFQHDMRGGGNG
ncbi:hypothetical protein E3P77_02399 [Wallemia ichthyophaga]|nr:hypothetical protein E3P77_02399 [Wallemia ichthyophaga]